MLKMGWNLFADSWAVLCLLSVACRAEWVEEYKSPFKIILDGGSTGSRLHIFEFVQDEADNSVDCVRRGSSRANIPLSAFGRLSSEADQPLNATHVADHLVPLFEYAASIVPEEYHFATRVKYQATAGMRLLEESEQDAVYDALYQGLMEHPSFVFRMEREDIATLSGELEGFYGAVAANYLQGVVDAQLRFSSEHHSDHSGPVGSLDMGGSSTQIVFLPGGQDKSKETCHCDQQSCPADSSVSKPSQLNGDHFFSTSYLSYGVDQFRERLWESLIEAKQNEKDNDPDSCASEIIWNPCANKGYEVRWNGHTLVGTGETDECIRQTQRLIPHPQRPHDDHDDIERTVGGVCHPPVRGKFLAMSLYFFSLDSLRVFSEPDEDAHLALSQSWPNPSIEELHNALDGLCSREWEGDMELQRGVHSFTREEVLPHRCLEAVYMVTLLKDGFGFHPTSRDITFTFLVDGSEVEWTLGMTLSLYADETAVDGTGEQRPEKINVTFKDEVDGDGQQRFQTTAHPLFVAESI